MQGKLLNSTIIQLSKCLDKLNKYKVLYFINPVEKYILVCNKKCASTSLRRLFSRESNPDTIFHIKSPYVLQAWLENNDISGYKKILFCRNPYARFLSFYFDKIIKASNKEPLRWAYTRLFIFSFTGPKEYKSIIKAVNENNHTVAIHLLMSNIPNIYFKYSSYFRPQFNIYTRRGKKLLEFDHILKLEKFDNNIFKETTGKSLKQENTSSSNTKNFADYLDEFSIRRLNEKYKEDFLQFGYQQISPE